ncbi:hypothetical protein NTHI1209_02067 [Haemophilus influenzae]|uniref:Uncharacterized protein n=1 Tax=Haemophilus influenzae TaxID=727 RepID=A0A158SZX3_HAEIF|nr:hypothetical protein NTHI1209_02067 [Haemophilus influenzae]
MSKGGSTKIVRQLPLSGYFVDPEFVNHTKDKNMTKFMIKLVIIILLCLLLKSSTGY